MKSNTTAHHNASAQLQIRTIESKRNACRKKKFPSHSDDFDVGSAHSFAWLVYMALREGEERRIN